MLKGLRVSLEDQQDTGQAMTNSEAVGTQRERRIEVAHRGFPIRSGPAVEQAERNEQSPIVTMRAVGCPQQFNGAPRVSDSIGTERCVLRRRRIEFVPIKGVDDLLDRFPIDRRLHEQAAELSPHRVGVHPGDDPHQTGRRLSRDRPTDPHPTVERVQDRGQNRRGPHSRNGGRRVGHLELQPVTLERISVGLVGSQSARWSPARVKEDVVAEQKDVLQRGLQTRFPPSLGRCCLSRFSVPIQVGSELSDASRKRRIDFLILNERLGALRRGPRLDPLGHVSHVRGTRQSLKTRGLVNRFSDQSRRLRPTVISLMTDPQVPTADRKNEGNHHAGKSDRQPSPPPLFRRLHARCLRLNLRLASALLDR